MPLKILAAPKPPSPAMYFSSASEKYVSKDELDLSKHTPNGRKRYLPQPGAVSEDTNPWITSHPQLHLKQKLQCKPIPNNSIFYFHIDFENLSAEELQLLIVSITPQTAVETDAVQTDFQHQLGLGKPFGLGQIKVEQIGTFLIDRIKRYSKNQLFEPRYQQWWGKQPNVWKNKLKELFAEEYAFASHQEPTPSEKNGLTNDLIDTDSLSLLMTVGNPKNIDKNAPVCYPFTTDQGINNETDGFQWFVKNDKKDNSNQTESQNRIEPDYLKKILVDEILPTLKS